MNNTISKSIDFAESKVTFKTGKLAPRANASILASVGETVVLTTVTVGEEDSDRDYFPLTVEYIEKFYAGGVISGSRFVKRERFPSEEAILKARMIDRSLRPLFPDDFRKEVQVVVTVLSYDEKHDPAIVGINSASAAVLMSGLPFEGPVTGVRIGLVDDKLIVNPSNGDLEKSKMDFVLSGREDKVVMIDAGANEIPEDKVSEAFDLAQTHFQEINSFQEEFAKEAGNEKIEYEPKEIDEELVKLVEEKYDSKLQEVIYDLKGNIPGERRSKAISEIKKEIKEENEDKFSKSDIENVIESKVKEKVRYGILKEKKRPSGRDLDEVRNITCDIGILPRTHGSAVFARGITQSLSIVTLGSTKLEQIVESYEGEDTKRYMHHYNGPSFSYGEAGRYSYYPGRREIGHGALAEKALQPVLPSEEDFPYTVRVVSEVLSQQGSSSMAATCGSTLALMDAGVPIKATVGGIAIGLVTDKDSDDFVLITDMQDLEDFYGDMDFKATGTKDGITAIQMDNKLNGIKISILKQALKKARDGRLHVIEKMNEAIEKPREKLSEHAPKITTIEIDPSKIGDLIGPGGKVIRQITEDTGVEIDVKETGAVHIAAASEEARDKALEMIEAIVAEPEVGKVYTGTIDKVAEYGAFIDVSPAISGLIHISELSDKFIKDPNKIVSEGDKVKAKLIKIDDEGRLNFSMKQVRKEE